MVGGVDVAGMYLGIVLNPSGKFRIVGSLDRHLLVVAPARVLTCDKAAVCLLGAGPPRSRRFPRTYIRRCRRRSDGCHCWSIPAGCGPRRDSRTQCRPGRRFPAPWYQGDSREPGGCPPGKRGRGRGRRPIWPGARR